MRLGKCNLWIIGFVELARRIFISHVPKHGNLTPWNGKLGALGNCNLYALHAREESRCLDVQQGKPMLAWQRHEQLSEYISGPARGLGRACLSCNRLISLAGSNTPRSCRHTVVEASTVLTPQPRGGGSELAPNIVTASLFARVAISPADRSSVLVRSASLHATNRGGRWLLNKLYSVADIKVVWSTTVSNS